MARLAAHTYLPSSASPVAPVRFSAMEITGKVLIVLLAVFLLVAPPWMSCNAQPPDEVARGIQLYRDGKMKEAVSVLGAAVKKQRDNPDAWHILGLAQYKIGDTKPALKSFENAIKLRPDFAPARISLAVILLSLGKMREAGREAEQAIKLNPQSHDAYYVLGQVRLWEDKPAEALKAVDAALQINNRFPAASLLKALTLLRSSMQQTSAPDRKRPSKPGDPVSGGGEEYQPYKLLSEAAANLETYLKYNQDVAENEFWREQLEAMRFYAERAEKKKSANLRPELEAGYLRPTILYKEKAKYTKEASDAGVHGMCLLKVEFAADGKVKHIMVLQDPGYGLAQEAVRAASKIRFIPVMKDRKPVSFVGNVEYNFN
ncbi:MAG: tetratricopeptide repeat protein [Acidobacteriota bacterium]